ncbi:MAG: type II toxin-antitoxin system mRNA interferase toxin, RelE/StbE family [Candidatus Neomarinimicrobiota bacterium]
MKPLKGQYHDYFRLRIGDYRVIYSQEETRLVILVIRLGHRKEIK